MGRAALTTASRLDFPAFGAPMIPTSASSFNSRRRACSTPGSPSSAKRGYLLVEVAKLAFPLPPRPPWATTTLAPGSVISATLSFPVQTSVPTGTRNVILSPSFPRRLLPWPWPPSYAANRALCLNHANVVSEGSHKRSTEPPEPPSPPSGPPLGTNFSRLPETTPFPPLPLRTVIDTESINGIVSREQQ